MHSVLNEDGFLDAISSMVSGAAETARQERNKNKNTYMYGSISRYAQKLILSFPIICDNTIPISTVQLISKAHEKNLVSLFEMLFASMPLHGSSGVEVLSQLHKNLGADSSIEDIIDAIEKAVGVNESGIPFSKAELRDIVNEMCHYLKYNQKVLPVDSFSERSLNDYIVRESYSGTIVMENNNPDNRPSYTKKEHDEDVKTGYGAGKKDQSDEDNEKAKDRTSREQIAKDDRSARARQGTADRNARAIQSYEDRRSRKEENEKDRDQKKYESELNLMKQRVKDVDYKKANELQPSLMVVTYNILDKNGQVADKKAFVAGVKSRMVGSDAMEIVERIAGTSKNKLTFKDLIRATTGEISLLRDFIAATKQAKINARNAAKRGETAKMWNLLAARARQNKQSGVTRQMRSNDASAITSLVINQETVNYLANQYKVNLESPKEAEDIMNEFNLLALFIADEANEVVKCFYHGNNSFELIAYSSLSRDQRDDKNYMKSINLINKTGR